MKKKRKQDLGKYVGKEVDQIIQVHEKVFSF